MVLILPEVQGRGYCPQGAATAGLHASLQHAILSGCDENLAHINIRVLGPYVVIEGFVNDHSNIRRIRDIAEAIAGKGRVRLGLFCL